MKRRTAIIITIVALIVPFLLLGTYAVSSLSHTPVTEAKTTPQSKYDVGAPESGELLELVNAERATYGVAPLVMDDRLNQSAQMKADDMVARDYFDHKDPSGQYNGLIAIRDSGVPCEHYSENIRDNNASINTSRETFDAWVASQKHHTAMINGAYTLTGLGASGDMAVQHFCQQ